MTLTELLGKQEAEYKTLLESHRSEWQSLKKASRGGVPHDANQSLLNRQGAELRQLHTRQAGERETFSQAEDSKRALETNSRGHEQEARTLTRQKEENLKKQQQDVKREHQQQMAEAKKAERQQNYNQNNIASSNAMEPGAQKRQQEGKPQTETDRDKEKRRIVEKLKAAQEKNKAKGHEH